MPTLDATLLERSFQAKVGRRGLIGHMKLPACSDFDLDAGKSSLFQRSAMKTKTPACSDTAVTKQGCAKNVVSFSW